MKSVKRLRVPRNPFVVHAINRKAGSHTKPHKAVRGKLNRELRV